MDDGRINGIENTVSRLKTRLDGLTDQAESLRNKQLEDRVESEQRHEKTMDQLVEEQERISEMIKETDDDIGTEVGKGKETHRDFSELETKFGRYTNAIGLVDELASRLAYRVAMGSITAKKLPAAKIDLLKDSTD